MGTGVGSGRDGTSGPGIGPGVVNRASDGLTVPTDEDGFLVGRRQGALHPQAVFVDARATHVRARAHTHTTHAHAHAHTQPP